MMDFAMAVFIGNALTVVWAYSMNTIIKASNEARKQSPYALLGFCGPILIMLLFLFNV